MLAAISGKQQHVRHVRVSKHAGLLDRAPGVILWAHRRLCALGAGDFAAPRRRQVSPAPPHPGRTTALFNPGHRKKGRKEEEEKKSPDRPMRTLIVNYAATMQLYIYPLL
ncbi:hypothetical protein BRADI_5g15248v3 [Brachypodium distachyon]|uniref:Uncharacterized protein n=1 Tax=Brachypodium distachyon TaxID=15368 RepID=A0A2K2CHE6_BRADI|nr:hypothetical protein BRADI_5g15248v3 [Brachypodium distachyon]